jgi:Ca-activated chloride channel homolog
MPGEVRTKVSAVLLGLLSLCFWSGAVFSQTRCLSDDDVKRMLAQVNSTQSGPLNEALRLELLKLKDKDHKTVQSAVAGNRKTESMMTRMRASRDRNTAGLCPLLKEFGWPTAALAGSDGEAAAFFLLRNGSSAELQKDLLPVIIAAVKKGELPRADFAKYIDRLRLSAGLKQLFGTQVTVRDGFLVLYPIESEAEVEHRRKEYGLEPLSDYLRAVQGVYHLPLVKSTGAMMNAFGGNGQGSIAKTTGAELFDGEVVGEDEIVRVNTNLVNLNVSVFSQKLRTHVSMLEQKDFTVSEDGHEETVSFFASTDVPFDLVLLLDVSGSTAGKRDVIRKSTERFIQAARPSDRLAIVTFSEITTVISPLTEDRAKLLASVKQIDGNSGSNVWDALKFTLDEVVGNRTPGRRRAVVFMTDGVDNALSSFGGGSAINFADLLETVRHSDALIVPIYLDTEEGGSPSEKTMYESARKTLELLAEESGGLYYKARKINDLNGVYDQVIADLGKVYSLGYKPTNDRRDGTWRTVKIAVPGKPELMTRARPGYYAN